MDARASRRVWRSAGTDPPVGGRGAAATLRVMETIIHIFVGLHIIGIAALLGGFFTQVKALASDEARIAPGMLHGALTMLLTGIVLVGLNQADDNSVNNVKIGIKLVLLVAILGLVYVKRDDERVPPALMAAVGVLTCVNIYIAVLWT